MKTWISQLVEAGFPTTVLLLDFETFYDTDYSLDKLSTVEYVADFRFECLGFGYQILNSPIHSPEPAFAYKPDVASTLDSFRANFGKALHNVTVVAKNCKFDMLILAEKYGLYPPFTLDIDDLLRHYDARMSHKMKDVAPEFGFGYKGDLGQFKGKHFDDLDRDALREYCLNDIRIEAGLMKKFLPIVVNPKFELALMRHTLGLYIRPSIHYDFDLATKLKADMKVQMDHAVIDAAGWVMLFAGYSEGDQQCAWDDGCWLDIVKPYFSSKLLLAKMMKKALPAGEKLPTKPGKPSKNMIPLTGEGLIPAFAKDDEGFKALLNHADPTVRMLMTACQALHSWPNHIGRIENMEKQAHLSGGLLRNPLKYYGGHTGRWSGEEGINTGNLGGSGRGKEISKLIGQVRHTMTAPPGCDFIMADSAQIEARRLASLAGQEDLLEEFRNNGDPYATLATELFQERVWKPSEEEEQTPEGKLASIRRGFGKDAILGCGYGMGAAKFFKRCYSNEALRPLFDSGEYDEAFVQRLVDTYRTRYACIPLYWRSVERAWRVATKYGQIETVGSVKIGNLVTFWHKCGTTFMRLPSGRVMRYRNAAVNSRDELHSSTCINPVTNPYGKLWGGTLTENIDQADCRDALGEWILAVEQELKLHVAHHVYDELVVVVDSNRVDEMKPKILEVMSRCPAWAKGMPYKAEAKVSHHYKK